MIAPPACRSRDVAQTMAANVLIVAISVVVGPVSARLLGVDGRGELAAILLVPQLAFLLSVVGVHEAVVFHAARRQFATDVVLGAALAISVPLAVLGTVGSLVAAPQVLGSYRAEVRWAAQLYAVSIPIGIVQGVLMRVLQGTGRFGVWNAFRVLAQLNALLALLLLRQIRQLTPASFALGMLLLQGASLVGLVIVFRAMGLLRVGCTRQSIRALWQYSWQTAAGTVPQIANLRLDQLIIATTLTPYALGLYTTAVSWSTGFLPLSSAYGGVVFPGVAAAREAPGSFVRAMRRGLIALVAGWMVFFGATPWLFGVIYGNAFSPALMCVLVLVVASLMLGANQMLGEGIKGLGRPMLVSAAELTGLAVTVAGLVLLIPRFGIAGAALASLVAYTVTLIVLLGGLHWSGACSWRDLLLPETEGRSFLPPSSVIPTADAGK